MTLTGSDWFWIAWIAAGAAREIWCLIHGYGTLTGFFFRHVNGNDALRATFTAFFAWWVYHWYLEPRLFPNLKGPGPDDGGIAILTWLLAFFGQRRKK